MPVQRDSTLQPRIDPPRGVQPSEVRRRWPGAVEALEQLDVRGRLTVDSENRLWFENDMGTRPEGAGPFLWSQSGLHGMVWIPQAK